MLTIILGPTAVGKTQLSLEMAKSQGAHIVSADAFQVYQGMDIGTAKPSLQDREDVPHYLIDILPPSHQYSVSDFIHHVSGIVTESSQKEIPLIICGGTSFYLNAFLYGFEFEPDSSSPDIANALYQDLESQGLSVLVERLMVLDPECADYMDIQNPRRVVRALTIFETTGQKPSQVRIRHPRTDVQLIGLEMDRAQLINRIHHRVDIMLASGWIEEVHQLLAAGYSQISPGFQAIGYREITSYLQGHLDYGAMVELIKTKTRQFSKRQMTWYRKFLNVEWRRVS